MKKILFEDSKNVIARQLKLARIQAGLTQGQLAAQMQTLGVNLDQQMISKIENNARFVTDYELGCFCRALRKEPRELLSDFFDKGE